jgi:hypothetical protein
MSLSGIVTALETALATMPGVALVDITQPETPPTGANLPAIVGMVQIPGIGMAGADLRRLNYQIDLFYLAAERGGDAKAQRDAILDKPAAMLAIMDANTTLGSRVYGFEFGEPSVSFDAIAYRDKTYVGFQMTVLLKEKQAVTFTG